MARWISTLGLGGVLLSAAPAWTMFGIGVHAGMDMFTIDETAQQTFNLINTHGVSISREEVSNPYHFGLHIFLDMVPAPFIDEIDLSVDFSSAEYTFQFDNPNYTSTESQIQPEAIDFSRVGAAITVRHYLAKFPPVMETVRLYVGVGLGMQLMSPVVGRDLIYDNLFDSDNPLNLEEQGVIDKSSKAAFVGLVGIRVKPPLLPLSIRAEGRYFGMGEWNYEQPDNYFAVSLGVSYSM